MRLVQLGGYRRWPASALVILAYLHVHQIILYLTSALGSLRSHRFIAHRDRAQASGPVLELVVGCCEEHPRCRRRDTLYLIRTTQGRCREHPTALSATALVCLRRPARTGTSAESR